MTTKKWSEIAASKGATDATREEGRRRIRAALFRRAVLRAGLVIAAATGIAAFLWAMNVLGASWS